MEANALQVVAVVETWLHDRIDNDSITPRGYKIFRKDRPSRGGGICILADAKLQPESVLMCESIDDIELIAVDLLAVKPNTIRVAVVYCPPNCANSMEYVARMVRSIEIIVPRRGNIVVLGDFNRPGINWMLRDNISCNTSIDLFFRDSMNEMGLSQIANFPTRGNNYLSLVFCRDTRSICTVESLPPFNHSDTPPHLPVCVIINEIIKPVVRRSAKRNYNAIDYTVANLQITGFNSLSHASVQEAYLVFSSLIGKLVESAPLRRQFRHRPPAWNMAKIKNKAWRILKNYPTDVNRALYESISLAYRNQIACIRGEALVNICNSADRRAFFGHSDSNRTREDYLLLRREDGKLCSNDSERAQVFLKAFDKSYCKDDPIDQAMISSITIDTEFANMFNPGVIYDLIKKLKNKSASGPDGIPALFLKNTARTMAHQLSSLFFQFLREGWIPQIWRSAIIIPIFKGSGSAASVNNYRPIALTCIVAKLFERCILKSLLPYLLSNDLVPPGQFGGMPGRSTTIQLINCFDQWSRMQETGTSYDVFFLDITKAFDRVPRSRLAASLCNMGIPRTLVKAIMLVFDHRTHRVRVGDDLSTISQTSSGVVQGTVLGCILFVLYTAPLSTIIRPIIIFAFIDDMKWTVDTANDNDAQSYLNKIVAWLRDNGLEISAHKSRVLHCGSQNDRPIYTTNSVQIPSCDTQRDLGVSISRDLSFKSHIESIVFSANRSLFGVLTRYKGCDRESLTLAYSTFVRPILEYAAPLWSPSMVTQIDYLERVQRAFTRKLFPFNSTNYEDRCALLSINSLEWRRVYLDIILLYKVIKDPKTYTPLNCLLTFFPPSSTRGHNLRLKIPFTRNNTRRNSFFLRASEVWNTLPSEIVNSKNLSTFKAKLKDFNLGQYCHRYKF